MAKVWPRVALLWVILAQKGFPAVAGGRSIQINSHMQMALGTALWATGISPMASPITPHLYASVLCHTDNNNMMIIIFRISFLFDFHVSFLIPAGQFESFL